MQKENGYKRQELENSHQYNVGLSASSGYWHIIWN
jgi:hypothetical protein